MRLSYRKTVLESLKDQYRGHKEERRTKLARLQYVCHDSVFCFGIRRRNIELFLCISKDEVALEEGTITCHKAMSEGSSSPISIREGI